ncbi:MAG: glycoside hydrolase family 88 protein [Oscillospiraceae bacterium]|nr:glycoside hydrolase family 88 protein [Oscillospiraceae bacterium]
MTLERYIKDYLGRVAQLEKTEVNYRDGCLMTAAEYLYDVTGDAFYRDVILQFGGRHVSSDGAVPGFDTEEHNVDKLRFGTALCYLYRETGEERYKRAIDMFMDTLRRHPRTADGSFWHKNIYPYQVWLDGLYMAMPFYLLYENTCGTRENYADVMGEFRHVRHTIFNKDKGLYHHAWDEKKVQIWADPKTGLSPNFWLRAMGWTLMALVDCYEIMHAEAAEDRRFLQEMLQETLDGLLPYRDPSTGLFYQLVDLPDVAGNYLETSGSIMVAYALLKGTRLGMLTEPTYPQMAEDMLCSIQANMLPWKDGRLTLENICGAAGLGPKDERDGSVAYYLSEPKVADSPLGAATLMMAYAEWQRQKRD